MAAENGGGEDLADLINEQDSPSLFILENDGGEDLADLVNGDTVLHVAARRGNIFQIFEILNDAENSGRENFMEALCRKRNERGNTALHEAVMKGRVGAFELLYAVDEVVLHYPNKECKSPLYLAIMENRNEYIINILFPSDNELPIEENDEKIHRFMRSLYNKPGNLYNFPWTLDPEVNQEELRISDIVDQVGPTGDTLLHAAARLVDTEGNQETVQFIASHFPHLITRKNIRGDTALHAAVRSQSLHNMIIILTCYAEHSGDVETLCRMRNDCGNTALHEAVDLNCVGGASLLLSADKVVAHYLNAIHYSPLCLAVLKDNKELVDVLLHAPFINVESHEGNSPLHAAIFGRSSGGLMKKLLNKRLDLIKRTDQKGGTPLHYAASIGYLEGVRTLVKAGPLNILERNTKGYLPIHVASKKGHVEVVKELVEQEWYFPLTLINLEGQNILHIAAKNGKHQVVSYILREKKLEKLLNVGDKNGNTPLHLATESLFPKVMLLLIQDKRIEVNLSNNQCLTSGDIVTIKRSEGASRSRTLLSAVILRSARAFRTKKTNRFSRNTFPEWTEPWLKEYNNKLMLLAILVATVTFAAGFTTPGGFIGSDDTDPKKRGTAILVNRWMFHVFAICDAVAMYSSIIASIALLGSQLGDLHWAASARTLALILISMALFTMSVAFMAGLHLVVVRVSWLSGAVIIIGAISLSIFLFGSILFAFPFRFQIPILRHIVLILCRMSGSYSKLPEKKQKKTKELEQQMQKDETQQVTIDMPETQH